MAVEVFRLGTAPGWAKHSSSFNSDDRCEDIYYVVGSVPDEVVRETLHLYKNSDATDWDMSFSHEAEKWVGVVTMDKE